MVFSLLTNANEPYSRPPFHVEQGSTVQFLMWNPSNADSFLGALLPFLSDRTDGCNMQQRDTGWICKQAALERTQPLNTPTHLNRYKQLLPVDSPCVREENVPVISHNSASLMCFTLEKRVVVSLTTVRVQGLSPVYLQLIWLSNTLLLH